MKRVLCTLLFLCALISCAAAEKGDFSPQLQAALAADKALYQKYGIEPDMLGYFVREVTEAEEGFDVTYTGMEDFTWVLGTYTVAVRQDTARARWSHDGQPTAGGFEADVWGKEQLTEMMRIVDETWSMAPFQQIARQKERQPLQPSPSPRRIQPLTAMPNTRLSQKELEQLARRAVIDGYDLSAKEALSLNVLQREEEIYQPVYGRMCQQITVLAESNNGHVPLYRVYVDLETGEIMDMIYFADRSGNG